MRWWSAGSCWRVAGSPSTAAGSPPSGSARPRGGGSSTITRAEVSGSRVSLPVALVISSPDWLEEAVDWTARYRSDEDRMRVAVEFARQSVMRGWGGPFGAGVFDAAGG